MTVKVTPDLCGLSQETLTAATSGFALMAVGVVGAKTVFAANAGVEPTNVTNATETAHEQRRLY